MSEVLFGSARSANVKGGSTSLGDQAQAATPDMAGEVSMQKYYNHDLGWYVSRCIDPEASGTLAKKMTTACNNKNIGYSQKSDERSTIYKYGVASKTPCACDCSSLVCECINETFNSSIYATTDDLWSKLDKSGLFNTHFKFIDTIKTPLYVGDVLCTRSKGHVVIVVQGNVRTGANYDPAWLEEGLEADLDNSSTLTKGSFKSRIKKPNLTKVSDEDIEAYEAGLISMSDLKDEYDMFYLYEDPLGLCPFESMNEKNYAWARFSEILDIDSGSKLSKGYAHTWYKHTEDGYDRSMAPEWGSAMCFVKSATTGKVCIVEDIIDGEKLITSEWDNITGWKLVERKKRYGSWDTEDGYIFQGFIHNPKVDANAVAESALDTFLRIASTQVGDTIEWVKTQLGDVRGNQSALFVVACSKRAGSSLNIIIPNVSTCSAIGRVGILRNMGTWLDGPYFKNYPTYQAGDIVLFRSANVSPKANKYEADKCAIVIESGISSIRCIICEDNSIKETTFKTSNKSISGLFRPNWSQIDGTTASVIEYRNVEGLYTEGVTAQDAACRTVCNYDLKTHQPSIQSTHIKLAAINYTGLLANFYSVFAQSSVSEAADSELIVDLWTNSVRSYYQTEIGDFGVDLYGSGTSQEPVSTDEQIPVIYVDVDYNRKTSYQYLKSRGYSDAATIGILANIEGESHFRTDAQGDKNKSGNYTSFGICQWHNNRGDAMKQHANPNWYSNLTGQLSYLCLELDGSESATKKALLACPNTYAGMLQAVKEFVYKFERPADPEGATTTRQGYGKSLWEQLVGVK